jgi:class 3 adenylate cyclase
MDTAGRRLAAIMFTDMVGFSRMAQEDEASAMACVDAHRAMVRRLVSRHDGREIETTGDGFLIEFQSALQAVAFGIALQRQQGSHNSDAPPGRQFQIRIGIHLGEIESRGSTIIGDGVNIAARIEPLSPHGGLAISAAVHALLRGKLVAPFRSIGSPELKNITEALELFVLHAAGVDSARLPQLPQRAPGMTPMQGGPHGLLLMALAQALAALINIFLGFALIVLPTVARDPKAGVPMIYLGVAANLLGIAMLCTCYGLIRRRAWGRTGSLALNFSNVPLAIAILATLSNHVRLEGGNMFPIWAQLLGPTLSLLLLVYFLHAQVARQFRGN